MKRTLFKINPLLKQKNRAKKTEGSNNLKANLLNNNWLGMLHKTLDGQEGITKKDGEWDYPLPVVGYDTTLLMTYGSTLALSKVRV